ncbi:hypothetical protein SAMN05660657_05693 [Geodermatophilus amargosae]|uniref:Uncharacterized protein n=1 Tax=Geodermatophilus amargosae TaxID=1296565 RepID=A0A1I7DEL2_9ACTN|nr:hypothetical protein SAMN05660657_05693 [Geodermatophilus amargosae]
MSSLDFYPEICLTGFSGQSEITLTVQQPDGSSWSRQVKVLDEFGSTKSFLSWGDPVTGLLGVYRIEAWQDGVSASLNVQVAPEPQPTRISGHGGFLLSGFGPGQRVAVQLYSGPAGGGVEPWLSWISSDTVTVDAQGQARYLVPGNNKDTCWGLLIENVVDPGLPPTACF